MSVLQVGFCPLDKVGWASLLACWGAERKNIPIFFAAGTGREEPEGVSGDRNNARGEKAEQSNAAQEGHTEWLASAVGLSCWVEELCL